MENKFKSIPNKEQLDKYNNIIKNRICFIDVKELQEDKKRRNTLFSIVLNEENTTRYLMAPKLVLDNFAELLECPWLPVRYEDIRDVLLRSKIDTDNFTATFINHYANFLKNMLQLTEDIETNLEQRDNHAFPNQKDIRELSKIRIHDFYEKLWFSVLLSKIEITNEDKMELLKGSGYTRSLGLLDFKITDAEKHVVRGVQIQNLQLRVILEPQIAIKKGDDRYTWQKTYAENDFNDYFQDIFKKIGEEPNGKLCKFGDFKYQYTPIDHKISIKDLSKKINNALDAIYHQSPSENLEGRKK